MSLTSWDNNVVGYYGPAIFLAKSGSSTIGTNARLDNLNSILGSIIFSGDDGDEFIKAAMIQSAVDAATGNNDMAGRLIFLTTPDGAQEPIERLRIESNGNVRLNQYSGNAGQGRLTFGSSGPAFIEGYDSGNAGSGAYIRMSVNGTEKVRIPRDTWGLLVTSLS